MHTRRILAAAVALALAGCGTNHPELIPIPGGSVQPAPGMGAAAEAAGVRLEVQTDAWRGLPRDLGENFDPVLVRLTNDGNQPIRIRYADFVLRAPSGDEYHALPPFNIKDTVVEPIEAVQYSGFMVAPYLAPYFPGLRVFRDPFLFDEVYFNRFYPAFVRIQLPTGDMIQKALPEGVLQPGGRVSGFLYFEDPDDDVGRVELTQTLISTAGARLGEIKIGFETR